VAVAITRLDDLYYTADSCRLAGDRVRVYRIVDLEINTASRWREAFAREVLDSWQNGHDVWLPKRLVADKPLPEWNWTEGDNPAISWKHLVAFARRLDWDKAVGDADGFLRIARSEHNERQMKSAAEAQTD